MTDCAHISACRLCDSRDLDLIISFTPTPPGDQYLKTPRPQPCYPLDLVICRGCGAVQLMDTVNPALIYTDYIYTTSISPGLDAHFDAYAASVCHRLQPTPGASVVDIGSNDGTLLRAFQRRGCQVFGVDPARTIAEQATASGVPTFTGYFGQALADDLRDVNGAADIITANHVMANVEDLHDFIEGVKTLLAPDGTFVFETGYWPAILDWRLIDTIEHEHIHYFAVTPLAAFFERHDLRLVSVERQPTKGGSLRGFVCHAATSVHDASVEQLIAEEQGITVSHLRQWALSIGDLRCEMLACVRDKPRVERWVGYGAAVGSTLLLHHFGLGSVLTELWDANTSRHGMFSPGFYLPVMAPSTARTPSTSRADKIVIMAWRYAEWIMEAHPEHAGKWIIPLPSLRFT